MKRQHSVPIQLIRSLLIAPRKRAVDLEAVCAQARLEHWLDLINIDDDNTRFPLEELGVFLITLWRYMEDEAGGFLSHRLKLGTFSMMCHALISAPNLRRGLLRSARYIALLTDDLRLTLEEEGDEARFVFAWDNPLGEDEVFFITSMFVIWIRLSCWMIDR
ncbi:AraC family transcriptional regulator ligand-binding domain-containing protein, partial [Oleiphilus sp. HI0066]